MKKCCLLLVALLLLLSVSGAVAEGVPMNMRTVNWDGSAVGRCFAPSDFRIESNVAVCTEEQSLGNPLFLTVTAVSPEEDVVMQYSSARDYIQIVQATTGNMTTKEHVDGRVDVTTLTPMLRFMYPSLFCDLVASTTISGVEIIVDAENSYPELQDVFKQLALNYYNEAASMSQLVGVNIDDALIDACQRRYSFDFEGTPYYMCVAASVQALQYSMSMPSFYGDMSETDVTWGVPYTYLLLCPQAKFEQYYPCFSLFMDNTGSSDQFAKANERLSNEIRESVLAARSLDGTSSYCRSVLRDEASDGDDYSDERFTDYIFDNNDYTLSDGSHIKVDTAYDYVYEDGDGNIVVSNSAFAEPAGGNRLSPNH